MSLYKEVVKDIKYQPNLEVYLRVFGIKAGQGMASQHKGVEKLTQADIERLMGMRIGRRDGKLVKVYK